MFSGSMFSPFLSFAGFGFLFFIMTIWSLFWKAWALWVAARRGSKVWFGVMLVLNTVGILEILYIYIFSKEKNNQTVKNVLADAPEVPASTVQAAEKTEDKSSISAN